MKTRHIIVHLIQGEAKDAHKRLTRMLTERLDAFPIHDRIAPHLTLKRWFELDEEGMQKVYAVLDAFVLSHKQSNYRLHGLNNFGEGVIFIDVEPSPEMSTTRQDLMKDLHTIDEMTFDEYDAIENDFHATLAMRALKPFDFTETWDFLQSQTPLDFTLTFDNIAVMKKEGDTWIPERVWNLPA